MWRWQFFSRVRIWRDNFKHLFAFLQWKKVFILEKEAEKKALIWMSSMSECHWWYLLYKQVKICDSTTKFRIWQLQTPAEKRYLQKHLLAERFVFWGWWYGSLKPLSWLQCRLSTCKLVPVFTSWSICPFVTSINPISDRFAVHLWAELEACKSSAAVI